MMSRISAKRAPDFIVIGAMKCMTSTLHEHLASQDGIFMTTPKEPCYFSDDHVYERGSNWYASLFAQAGDGDICGESSTHYTKLPTHPHSASRMHGAVPHAKLIYVMRHPIDRMVSQYIHEWTERLVNCPLDEAIHRRPELIAYSRYNYQLSPYLAMFGSHNILPVFFERLTNHPAGEMNRIARFLGVTKPLSPPRRTENKSSERLRKSKVRDAFVNAPGFSWIRRALIPRAIRDRVKARFRMKERPYLGAETKAQLIETFDSDLRPLGARLGFSLNCDNWHGVCTDIEDAHWVEASCQSHLDIAHGKSK